MNSCASMDILDLRSGLAILSVKVWLRFTLARSSVCPRSVDRRRYVADLPDPAPAGGGVGLKQQQSNALQVSTRKQMTRTIAITMRKPQKMKTLVGFSIPRASPTLWIVELAEVSQSSVPSGASASRSSGTTTATGSCGMGG